MDFLSRIKQSPLIFDGAMGTEIYDRGVFIQACYDELCLSNPRLILQIHQDYIEAGAQVIETNTFGANPIKLKTFGLADKTQDINRAGVKLAREAAKSSGADIFLAGAVGPCTESNQRMPTAFVSEVEAAFRTQMSALNSEGVDLFVMETFTDLDELLLASTVAKEFGKAVLASFAINQRGETALGTHAETMASALDENPNVDVIGINCGTGPSGIFDALPSVLQFTGKPVVVMPNAGFPREISGRVLYMTSPEYFTEYAKKYIELGVRGVGGCCGTSPAHIRMMARAVGSLSGVKHHIEVKPRTRTETTVKAVKPEEKSRFAAKLLAGEKVTSVELLPPKSSNMDALLKKSRMCADAGIDAINIPDGPRASARVSPMIAALTIHREVEIEPVLHYCCRDRNLIGMQSDLLGGYAARLANFLIITGDPPKLGEYPDATGVFDVDSIGLVQMASNLNNGVDIGGNPIDPPTGIFIGVGANPCAVDMEREIERYYRKIDAGAEFVITQPVFDAEALMRFLDRVQGYHRTIPVIAGIFPLVSYKNAEFMNNEVPGVVVPKAILERMAKCESREDGRKAGVDIARGIIDKIRGRVDGFQVSAPLGHVETALEVLEKF